MTKKVILIVNLGTPNKPDVKHVGKYLLQFLNDSRVIDIPWLFRKILVNLIIVPFRVRKSTLLYKQLWTPKGSPLLYHLQSLVEKLQSKCADNYTVLGAMRYGNPSIKDALQIIKQQSFDEIIVVPLYPQYASSTTGSVHQFILEEMCSWEKIPALRMISQFYSHPSFINVFANQINSYTPQNYDKLLFSYHGLPLSQIQKSHPGVNCNQCTCENVLPAHGSHCYKATCYETTRLLAKKLNIPPEKYSISFQSRLSNKWLTPFTDKVLLEQVNAGNKKLLVIAPAFVTDCLETIVEIDQTFKQLFLQAGGTQLTMVESLNDKDEWVDAILEILN